MDIEEDGVKLPGPLSRRLGKWPMPSQGGRETVKRPAIGSDDLGDDNTTGGGIRKTPRGAQPVCTGSLKQPSVTAVSLCPEEPTEAGEMFLLPQTVYPTTGQGVVLRQVLQMT